VNADSGIKKEPVTAGFTPSQVRIVGSGLIGTSIGLALVQHGVGVEMLDSDSKSQLLAADLVRGATGGGNIPPELVIFALPTGQLDLVLKREFDLNPNSTFMDVGSVKSEVLLKVQTIPGLPDKFVPTHPMAGREIGGAGAARADLFLGRSWIITPESSTNQQSIQIVEDLIALLGASSVKLSAIDHDAAVAKISHLPQIFSSLLAKQLVGTKQEWMELSGQGLRDSTRIAGSDEELWKEIIFSNREALSPLLDQLRIDLEKMIDSLEDPVQISNLLREGRKGRDLMPGKHGGKAREYSHLPIVIDDKPGQLASIFNECSSLGVNVEDLVIEHSPGQLSALITLALSAVDAQKLSNHLSSIGWNVHPIRN
jgi:prephenate dehydrogenase